MNQSSAPETPWRRVFAKFGMKSQSAFARAIGCHRSKVSRALKDSKGLINAPDQERLFRVGKELGVNITANDVVSIQK